MKDLVRRIRRKVSDKEPIFVKYVSGKRLVSKIYIGNTETQQDKKKIPNNPVRKFINSYFT